MLKKNELALLTMELETADLSPEVYRYRTKYGVSVVYFMFDPELLSKYIFEPVYLSPEDVECEGMSEEDIFHAILESTVTIMHTEIIPFSEYFREFEEGCEDKNKLPIIRGIAKAMEEAKEESRVWCVTGALRERCASGALYRPLLREFCEAQKCSSVLIGLCDNDFAYLGKEHPQMASMMPSLVHGLSHIVDGAKELLEVKILRYNYEADTLSIFTEDSL
jgi:hypothetical protein